MFAIVILLIGLFGTDTILYEAIEPNMTHAVFAQTVPIVDDFIEEEDTAIECLCVAWLRTVKGVNIRGNASTIPLNVDRACVGGVVIQKYGDTFHASYILAILPNGNLYLEEANKEHCKVTKGRVLEKDSDVIQGYYFKNPN